MGVSAFFDWINSKGCILITYPQFVDAGSVIAAILAIPQMAGKNGFIMTRNSEFISKMSMIELPAQLFLPYKNSEMLKMALGMPCYIIIDDLGLFRLANLVEHFKTRKSDTRIIFLATKGVSELDLSEISDLIPSLSIFTARDSDSGSDSSSIIPSTINIPTNTTQSNSTSPTSTTPTSTSTSTTLTNTKHIANFKFAYPFPELEYKLEFSVMDQDRNFVYPDEIGEYLDFPEEHREKIPEDVDYSMGGWMLPQMIYHINNYSPKIANLLTIISMNKNSKHFVYSKYVSRYGLKLLSTLLDYLHIPNMICTKKDKSKKQKKKFDLFNSKLPDETFVFLTDISTMDGIRNLSHFHALEGTETRVLQNFVDRFYKITLYDKLPRKIILYSHISQNSDNSDSSDAILYRPFSEGTITETSIFDTLLSLSLPILSNPIRGLTISD